MCALLSSHTRMQRVVPLHSSASTSVGRVAEREEEKEQQLSAPPLHVGAEQKTAQQQPTTSPLPLEKDGGGGGGGGGAQQRQRVVRLLRRRPARTGEEERRSADAVAAPSPSAPSSAAAPSGSRSRRLLIARPSEVAAAASPASSSSERPSVRFPSLLPLKAAAQSVGPSPLLDSPPTPASSSPSPSTSLCPLPSLRSSSPSLSREGRVLLRHARVGVSFSVFQSALAARVGRAASALCVTNAGEEHRMRVERASIGEQQRRIAREAAAQHSVDRLTEVEEDGGLALPWEQSLRGAAVHEVQVGHLFSGLYCRITQPSMDDMEIIRTTKQITEAAEAEDAEAKAEERLTAQATPQRTAAAAAAVARSSRRLHGRPLRGGGASALRAQPSSSRALLSLVEEATRLQQLTRLAQLGASQHSRRSSTTDRRRRQTEDAEEVEEEAEWEGQWEGGSAAGSRLKLGDLLIRGTRLFDDLQPPPLREGGAGQEKRWTAQPSAPSASSPLLTSPLPPPSLSSASAASPSVLLACPSLLSFPARSWYEGDVDSGVVELFNCTDRTLHFDVLAVDEEGSELPSVGGYSGPFLVSHPSHHLLPHSSFSLLITFAPPACGMYRQRLRVVQVDGDSDAEGCEEVELVLEGVSAEPTLVDGWARSAAACSRVMSDLHSDPSALLTSLVGGWVGDVAAPRPATSEERAVFSRLNRSAGLHFHPSLASAWWALWEDIRALHRPLQRPSMQWNLHVERLQVALQQISTQHRSAVPALQLRLDRLREAAHERPPLHPTRTALLSALLSSIALALPPFAIDLRASLGLSEQPPWEQRRAERERQAKEREEQRLQSAALSHPTAAAQSNAEGGEGADREGRPSAAELVHGVGATLWAAEDAVLVGGLSAGAAAAALDAVTDAELLADADWRERESRCSRELQAEAAAVLSAALALFAARATPMGSDAAPMESNDGGGGGGGGGGDGRGDGDAEEEMESGGSTVVVGCGAAAAVGGGGGLSASSSLPRPFRVVAVASAEVEAPVAESKKGKSNRGKAATTPKKRT